VPIAERRALNWKYKIKNSVLDDKERAAESMK
jgi:hypothetical protein